MDKIINLILVSILVTYCLYIIPNKSNINKYYIIPIISFLIVKYTIGDLDKGSSYSFSDILHLLTIIFTSILFIWILDTYL